MKTLTLITGLFISLLGTGQEVDDNGITYLNMECYYDLGIYTYESTFETDSLFSPSEEELIQIAIFNNNLIYLLLKYKEKCYNDSSYVLKYNNGCSLPGTSINLYCYATVDTYDYEWTHKNPTFEGFIAWIEKYKTY